MYHRDVVGDIPDELPEGPDPEHDESYWESLYKEAPVDLGTYCEFENGCLYHHDGEQIEMRDQDQDGYWESLFAQEPPYMSEQSKDDGCKHNVTDPYAVLKDIPTSVLEAELLRRKRENTNRVSETAKAVQNDMTRQAQVKAGNSAVSDLLQIGAGVITARKYEAPEAAKQTDPYQPPVQQVNPYQSPVVEQKYQPPVQESNPYSRRLFSRLSSSQLSSMHSKITGRPPRIPYSGRNRTWFLRTILGRICSKCRFNYAITYCTCAPFEHKLERGICPKNISFAARFFVCGTCALFEHKLLLNSGIFNRQ